MSRIAYQTSKSSSMPLATINNIDINYNSTNVKMYKYQNIAPTPTPAISGGSTSSMGDVKPPRKYTPRSAPYAVDQSHSVQRRNARERNRVKQVNNSFARLRQHIPQTIITDLTKGGGRGPHKKVSKVDTLRIAVEYIRRLQDLVDDLNSNCGSSSSSSSSNASDLASVRSMNSQTSNAGSPPPLTKIPSVAIATANHSVPSTSSQLFYPSSETDPLPIFTSQHPDQFVTNLLTPVSLSAYSPPSQTQLDQTVCHSPTSSFTSNMSFDSGTFESSQQLSPQPNHLQLKFEPYDNFNLQEEDCTPDDEEILDYISLWQEQQ